MVRHFCHITALCGVIVGFSAACGSLGKNGKGSKRGGGSANATIARMSAFGDSCQENGTATTEAGKTARIALTIEGANPNTHVINYVADKPVHVNFNEVVYPNAQSGTLQVHVILMEKRECEEMGGGQFCNQQGARLPQNPGFGILSRLAFVVHDPLGSDIDLSNLGRGQSGIVNDIINKEGILGTLAPILSSLGGSGGSGSISAIADAGGIARQQGQILKTIEGPQVGGCTSNGNATIQSDSTDTSSTQQGASIP